MGDRTSVSLWVDESLADDLRDMAERWGRFHDGEPARTVPGRKALVAGIQFVRVLEREYGTDRVARMNHRELEGAARQGAIEYLQIGKSEDEDEDSDSE